MRPRQGETVHDYACGSAGLLIKCQLALRQRELRVAQPLKLFGQELEGASYAIAWMNTVIHDMDAEIVRGNSIVNPKFKDAKGRLRKFDMIVANPMWNQPFDASVYENDAFERFEEHGGRSLEEDRQGRLPEPPFLAWNAATSGWGVALAVTSSLQACRAFCMALTRSGYFEARLVFSPTSASRSYNPTWSAAVPRPPMMSFQSSVLATVGLPPKARFNPR